MEKIDLDANNHITNVTLAYICNNLENTDKYRVEGKDCYYDDEYIGTIEGKIANGIFYIYFIPIKKVEYVQLKFTITKTGEIIFDNEK